MLASRLKVLNLSTHGQSIATSSGFKLALPLCARAHAFVRLL
jgi:hypothetical protein